MGDLPFLCWGCPLKPPDAQLRCYFIPRTRQAVCSAATCIGLREENSNPQRSPVLFRATAVTRKVFADWGKGKRISTRWPKEKSAGVKTAIPLRLSSKACPRPYRFRPRKKTTGAKENLRCWRVYLRIGSSMGEEALPRYPAICRYLAFVFLNAAHPSDYARNLEAGHPQYRASGARPWQPC